MRQALVAGVIVMVTALAAWGAERLSVPLVVEERLGVSRFNEPVTSGVPLPKGAVKEAAELVLLDAAGKMVDAQFGVANRWWEDRSVKWLHVDFHATVDARATATYTLTRGPQPRFEPRLAVKKTESGYDVDTGAVRFTVKEKGFNLFDEVGPASAPLVKSHGAGILLQCPDGTYSPAYFKDTRITVEEQGPMKVVLLVTGQNVKEDGTGYAMDYKCRIYAYNNSPLIRVVYAVENRRGKWADHVDVADWRIELPLAAGPAKWCTFGLDKAPMNVSLDKSGDRARVDVIATDRYEFSGAAKGEGNPLKENPAWLGVLDAGNGPWVTVAVRNFWQMWAKYLEVDGTGKMTIGLWTDRVRDKGITTFVNDKGHVQFFAGVARTHEMLFRFEWPVAGKRHPTPPMSMAAAREPLFARCDPAWYCQGTKVFGDFSEANPEVYLPEWRDKIAALNKWAAESVSKPLQRWRTVKAGKNGAVDSFGMLNYGDSVEEYNDGLEPEKIHWEGGYYDYMHSIYLQFARTANLDYLWLATDMSSHNADIHHTHHDQSPGRSRYCPSYAHIIMDGDSYYASGTFNHWKNLSAFERWYLLGDHRAREAAMETLKFAMALGNSGIDFGQPRSICHGLLGFWAGYDATGDRKYLDAMAKFAKGVAAKIDKGQKMGSGGWQRGMALQGLCWYVEQTGDESVVPAITQALERDFSDGAGELAYACAFMWKRTGDAKYFQKAVRYLGGRAEQWMQRFGNNGRSKLYVPTIVRKDAPRKPPAEGK